MELVDGRRILVAVSGGPDSTALLIALREAGHDLVAAHYDHALRDGSDDVARQVADLCARLGVQLITERREEPLPKGSLQAGARSLRYAFLERARAASGADLVALAHTADDVVEGVVLHLLRGSGLAGMRGMPERRGVFVRPMLRTWRKDVSAFLEDRGVKAHEDPSNRDLRFARVRVRLEVLPALERGRPGISRRFHSAALAAAGLYDRAEKNTGAEFLKRMYREAGGPDPGLSRSQLEAMVNLTRGGRGGRGVDLPGGLRFRVVGGTPEFVDRKPRAPISRRLIVKSCGGCAEPGIAHLRPGLDLRIGFRTPGLRLRPSGGRGARKLQDVFVDARVPREDRDEWPLVFAGDRIAWVPGIAVDSEHAADPGRTALHVSIEPMPVRSTAKVVSLGSPETPRGESS